MAGIYIHIPFCKQACHYCNFHFSTSLKHKNELIEAIIKEIEQRATNWQELSFKTIYFGGGTPSLVESRDVEKILNKIQQKLSVEKNIEITLEGNPDDLNKTKLQELKNIGINRLSIGIQSFNDDDLVKLNRSHNAQQAEQVIKEAQKLGFDNITIDLIYGIPGLSNQKWEANIQKFLNFGIPHLSAYALTVEEKTALSYKIKKGLYPKVSEEQAAIQFEILRKKLLNKDFLHYEISNFGKPNYLSKHNQSYWQNTPYLGLGPAAHSYKNNTRRWNISNNIKYIKEINSTNYYEIEHLSKNDIYNETIMTGLRTIWGVDLKKIEALGKNYLELLNKNAQIYIQNNQLVLENNFLKAHPNSLFTIEGIISDIFIV